MQNARVRLPRALRSVADFVWVAIAVGFIVLGVRTGLQPIPTLEGDPVRGLALYQDNCTRCHAGDGAGGVKIGAAVSPDVRWNVLAEHFDNPALLRRAMLSGLDVEGHPLDSAMPRFRGHLIDAEIDNIVAFLQTLASPRLHWAPDGGQAGNRAMGAPPYAASPVPVAEASRQAGR